MAGARCLEDLRIWQEARELTLLIYSASNVEPFFSDWALRKQIRKATISVVSNIAEGFERVGNREFIHFLSIAKGSLGEVRAQIYSAADLQYIEASLFEDLQNRSRSLAAGIARLIASLDQSGQNG